VTTPWSFVQDEPLDQSVLSIGETLSSGLRLMA
jgi:hypothetical protein